MVKLPGTLPGASVAAAAIACACAGLAAFLSLDAIDAAFGTVLAAIALIIAAVDLDRFEIPDTASLAMFVVGLLWTQAHGIDVDALIQALARAVVLALLLFAIRAAYRAVRKVEGLGLGDVKLAGAGAVWLAPAYIAVAVLIAVCAAIAVIFARALLTGERMSATAAVPFGTFLAPAIWLGWFVQMSGF